MGRVRASFKGKTDMSVYISGLCCQKIEVIERRDLRKSIVGSLDRIDYPLLSGPYSKPVSLLVICRSREQAECGITLPQFLYSRDADEGHTRR